MLRPLFFGDLFIYNDEDYIFLANSEGGTMYAARILSRDSSRMLKDGRNNSVKLRGERETSASILFCFVELQTTHFSEQVAILRNSDEQKNEKSILLPEEQLEPADKLALKTEILDGPVPRALKNLVKDLDINT